MGRRGWKNIKYFFALEKRNVMRKNIYNLIVNNIIINDSNQILEEEYKFYSKLYEADNLESNVNYNQNLNRFFNFKSPKLSAQEKQVCEGLLTNDECIKVIKLFYNGKFPGNDGLTAEFYKIF